MKLFEIKDSQIIFYPRKHEFVCLGIILSICLFMVIIPIFLSERDRGTSIEMIYICIGFFTPLIIFALFIILSKTQIIIDLSKKTVTRKNLFQNKKLAILDNINHIQLSDTGYGSAFELIFKDDTYGKGIKLTPSLSKKSKKISYIYNNAIVHVEKKLEENISVEQNEPKEGRIHLFIEEHRGHYSYKEKNFTTFVFFVLPLVFWIYLIIFKNLDSYYHYFLLIISLISLMSYGRKVKIGLDNSIIETSYYGFFKKKCHFIEVAEILTQKSFLDGSYASTSIIIKTNREQKPFQIFLTTIKDTKKVALFINDLNILLNQNSRS